MTRFAAIDVGTNSVRVLVAEVDGSSIAEVERDLVITRLGEGVDKAKRLRAEAVRRTLEAITSYHEKAVGLGAERVRIAATSAVRDATNRHAFLHGVRERTGVELEVLSGDDEARLSFLGATTELTDDAPYLVLDIGGGSTEFVVGDRSVDAAISIDVGSVRLTERHVRHDPPTQAEIGAVRSDADAAVEKAMTVVGTSAQTLVGLAGTITSVTAIALELADYDHDAIHHRRLSVSQVKEVASRLQAMTSEQRRSLPAMLRGREDVIVAGAEILIAVMQGLEFDEVLVSEADILDGLVLDALGR